MPSLQLHRSIYHLEAVEQTAQVFEDYGTYKIHQSTESDHLRVDIEPTDPADSDELSGRFANYALALSIAQERSRQ
jgi:hypothetical protein